MNDETLEALRYYFQRILVPFVVAIGVLGNSISVIVLTRKWMRCSTNIYLTALAVADTIYLLLVLVLSLQHYEKIHFAKYELYWRAFGLSHWFCDAASYTSIYITVSFTIERYIAVCHPIKGQTLCTESRAKKVIFVVILFCVLCTCSTTFEHSLLTIEKYVNSTTGKSCVPENFLNLTSSTTESYYIHNNTNILTNLTNDDYFLTETNYSTETNHYEYPFIDDLYQLNKTNIDYFNLTSDEIENFTENEENSTDLIEIFSTTEFPKNKTKTSTCKLAYFFYAKSSALGENQLYIKVFLTFTSIVFAFIPLILLLTFNTFLILAVRKSNRLRCELTNANSRQLKHKISSISQENKITVTLIAVVILFIICQSPTAIYIVLEHPEPATNIDSAIGNIFNFLITLNAATNFILYCALSDKYRQTVKELILRRRHMRQNTLRSSYLERRSTLGQSLTSNRNQSFNKSPRKQHLPHHVHHKPSSSIQSNTKQSINPILNNSNRTPPPPPPTTNHHRNSFHTQSVHEHRPSICTHMNPTHKSCNNSTTSIRLQNDENLRNFLENYRGNNDTNTNNNVNNGIDDVNSGKIIPVNRFLRPSDSSGSLSRSRSLVLKPKTRHSPDCPDHPDNL